MNQEQKNEFFHKCVIKNLSPEPPSTPSAVEESIFFARIKEALEKRGWSLDWLTINQEKKILNIDHPSITEEEAVLFYEEVFDKKGDF